MSSLKDALDTVQQALETGQIGTPVAARLVVHTTQDHGRIERLAALSLAVSLDWLADRAAQLSAQGGAQAGQITTLVRTAGGRTALVSAGVCGTGRPLLEIVVWGNQGILSWEADDTYHPPSLEDTEQVDSGLLEQLRQALGTGQTVSLDETGDVRSIAGERAARPRLADPFSNSGSPRRAAPPYGVLLVSGDHTHQPGYAEAFAADERCRLIGVTDTADVPAGRRELNRRLADRLGIPLLPDLDEALARKDVQIVSVCAEPYRRGEIIVRAAQAGKHVYLDKPLAASRDDAAAILAAIRAARVVGHMFSQVHWGPSQQVRAIVDSPCLGQLVAVHCDLCFAKGQTGTADLGRPRQETADPDRYELPDSKRELTNVGVYCLVMLLRALRRRVKSVFAATGNYFFAEHQRNDMEDFGQLLLELEGDVTASIAVGRTGWRSHPGGGLNRVYLIGTQACAVVDAHRPRVEVWADVPAWKPPERNPEDPMGMWVTPPDSPYQPLPKQSWLTPGSSSWKTDVDHFLQCLEQGRPSEVSAELAAAATDTLLAAYRSAAAGTRVDLA